MPGGLAPAAQAFWDAFRASRSEDVQARFYEVCVFDDHEASAHALAALVVRGTQRGTARHGTARPACSGRSRRPACPFPRPAT